MGRLQRLQPRLQQLGPRLAPQSVDAQERVRGSVWMATRDRILTRDKGVCRCDECQRLGRLRPAHQVDHHVPLHLGGSGDDSNLRAINADCHAAKTAREAGGRAGRRD